MMRVQATIVRWDPMKGYGFASCDNSERDFFVHISDVNVDFLHERDRIEFEPEMHERGPIARRVKVLEFA
jgi:cold shock protein